MINDNFHPQIKNINQIKNRFFILSPSVKNNLDNESSRDDFTQEGGCKINLGYIGKGLKVTHKKTNKMYPIHEFNKYREEDNNLLISHIYQYQTSVSPLFVVPTFPIPISLICYSSRNL